MPKVTCNNAPGSVGITKANIKPLTYYELQGRLYLAIRWDKDTLHSVCFDTDYGTIHAEAQQCETTKVRLVRDRDIHIDYDLSPFL